MILASLLGKFSSPGLRGGKPVSFSGRGGLVDFKKKTSVHPTPRCVIDAAEDRGRDATSVSPATTPSCAVWPTAGVIHRARAGSARRTASWKATRSSAIECAPGRFHLACLGGGCGRIFPGGEGTR